MESQSIEPNALKDFKMSLYEAPDCDEMKMQLAPNLDLPGAPVLAHAFKPAAAEIQYLEFGSAAFCHSVYFNNVRANIYEGICRASILGMTFVAFKTK